MIWSKKGYRFMIRDWIGLGDLKASSEVVGTMRFMRNLEPLEMVTPPERRIVVVAPHQDDEILGAGGTLIKALGSGAQVKVVYLTSGKPAEASQLERETVEVSLKLGYETEFLRYPLGNIPVDGPAAERLGSSIREFAAQSCFVPFLLDDHDDHRRASQLLLAAYRGGLLPSRLSIWAYQVYSAIIPNVVVDITEATEDKAAALRTWITQNKSRDWAHYILGRDAFNVRFLQTKEPRYAEAFFVVPLSEYIKLCSSYFDRHPSTVYYSVGYGQK
jgi:LmbE family N-acetylglucosaminyl deacetylase